MAPVAWKVLYTMAYGLDPAIGAPAAAMGHAVDWRQQCRHRDETNQDSVADTAHSPSTAIIDNHALLDQPSLEFHSRRSK
jgi:hypothetical protein